MATQYHVNGPALVSIGPQGGGGGGLSYLGYSEDGVDLTIDNAYENVMGDVGGPAKPQELQNMAADANIRFRLLTYDLAILDNIRGPAGGGGGVDGMQGPAGTLVGTNGNAFRCVIQSATDEPWRFYYCVCRGAQSVRVGVRRSLWLLNLYSWTFVPATATTLAGLPLYDHVAA